MKPPPRDAPVSDVCRSQALVFNLHFYSLACGPIHQLSTDTHRHTQAHTRVSAHTHTLAVTHASQTGVSAGRGEPTPRPPEGALRTAFPAGLSLLRNSALWSRLILKRVISGGNETKPERSAPASSFAHGHGRPGTPPQALGRQASTPLLGVSTQPFQRVTDLQEGALGSSSHLAKPFPAAPCKAPSAPAPHSHRVPKSPGTGVGVLGKGTHSSCRHTGGNRGLGGGEEQRPARGHTWSCSGANISGRPSLMPRGRDRPSPRTPSLRVHPQPRTPCVSAAAMVWGLFGEDAGPDQPVTQ